ncbi:MAG: response regulator transcription factor [Clostridiales bacterium]|nr:response regulator transcription factor [Clostridiales bacterium]
MIKIVIVDDHVLLLESLKTFIEQNEEYRIVGEAKNGIEAIEVCKTAYPDVVLMDVKMPELDGIKASKELKKEFPRIKIIILTSYEDNESIFEAFAMGVDGYLLKNTNPKDLMEAIRLTVNGLCVIQRNIMEHFMTQLGGKSFTDYEKIDVELSVEDIKVLEMLSVGKTNREIAKALNYSEGTIKNRVSKMINLLDVKDRTQLVVFALKHDII